MARILVFEDDKTSLVALTSVLTSANHEVEALMDGHKAVDAIREFKPDLVIMDIMMPGLSGGDVYQLIRREIGPGLPVIISSSSKLRVISKADPFLAHCPKPIGSADLLATVRQLLADSNDGRSPK